MTTMMTKLAEFAGPRREGAREKKDQDERIGKAVENLQQHVAPPVCQRVVGPKRLETLLGLLLSEPGFGSLDVLEELREGRVPDSAVGHRSRPNPSRRRCVRAERAAGKHTNMELR